MKFIERQTFKLQYINKIKIFVENYIINEQHHHRSL